MVVNKNISGCLWNMIKTDDEAFDIGEKEFLWKCNISKNKKFMTEIRLFENEILNVRLYQKHEYDKFDNRLKYFKSQYDDENYKNSKKIKLTKAKKFHAKLRDTIIWVCEFDNGLYAIFTVGKKGEVQRISKFLLPLKEALYQGEIYSLKYSECKINSEQLVPELMRYKIKNIEKIANFQIARLGYFKHSMLSKSKKEPITIEYFYETSKLRVFINYNFIKNKVSIMNESDISKRKKDRILIPPIPTLKNSVPERNIEIISLQANKDIFIFKIIPYTYVLLLIEYENNNNITILNPNNTACSHEEVIKLCYEYIKENCINTGKIYYRDANDDELKWLNIMS